MSWLVIASAWRRALPIEQPTVRRCLLDKLTATLSGIVEQLKLLMACFNSATERKIPRLRRRRVSLAKMPPGTRDGHREMRICNGGTEQFPDPRVNSQRRRVGTGHNGEGAQLILPFWLRHRRIGMRLRLTCSRRCIFPSLGTCAAETRSLPLLWHLSRWSPWPCPSGPDRGLEDSSRPAKRGPIGAPSRGLTEAAV
jgi:hypothetical protein